MAMYLGKAMEMPCRQVWWLFEERYNEAYDDRAYHAKGLDALAKFAPTLEVRKGNAWYRRGQENMGGGSVNNRILTLVRRTHALIIGNSQSNQEVHKREKYPEEECM